MFACLHGNGPLVEVAQEFSPLVERSGPETVTFDVTGLERLVGDVWDLAAAISRRTADAGAKANLAIADSPDVAISAARGFPGISIVPRGDEAKFLAELPITLLDPSPETHEILEQWGIRRFRDMAQLPPIGIAERLGAEGLRLHDRALGARDRKLLLIEEAPRFEAAYEAECPVDLLEPLLFLLARLVNDLVTTLAVRSLATDELRLCLTLENRETHARKIRLPVPALDPKAFLKLIRLDLEAHPPAAPVTRLWMELNPAKPRAAQGGLYIPEIPEPIKLELTLARIRAVVGGDRVGSPEVLDTHRPDAFRLGRLGGPGAEALAQPKIRLALRRFRPPHRARVAIVSGRPNFVTAPGICGRVLDLAGPWRTSGDWWTAEPWSRDDWDVELSNGALYRIFCEPKGWFVDGNYD